MVVYKSQPEFKITTNYSGSPYVFQNEQFLQGSITRMENSFDIATLWMSDRAGVSGSVNWLSKVGAGEDIKIEFKDRSESSWVTVLDGIVRHIKTPFSKESEVLELKCDGAGYGFIETACGEEYGTESSHPTIDHVGEIFTDASIGVITKYVNKILGGASASGYSYTTITDAGTGTIRYVYFPYKPCAKAINDVLELEQATRGAGAGLHWLVTTDDKFLCTTIGSHSAACAVEGWTTYYGGSQAAATLEQGKDFVNFEFEQLAKEANYILYHGAFRRPGNGDKWTENDSASWDVTGGVNANYGKSDDNSFYKVGSYSLKCWTGDGAGANWVEVQYPSSKDAAWDLTAAGGQHNIPQLGLFLRRDSEGDPQVDFYFYTDAANYYYYRYSGAFGSDSKWYWITLPIGPYAAEKNQHDNLEIYKTLSPDWADIDYLGIQTFATTTGHQANFWIDNLHFAGSVLRGAKASGIGASDPLKVKLVTDDMGKDDTLKASDDSGTIAQLAYAELLRAKTTPIVGYVTTPLIKDLLPGQLLHIHAKKKSDGSFNIDKDMKVTKLIHDFSARGYITKIWLTDDVKNTICRAAYDDLNKLMAASRPEFQDRQASSLKARSIDVTQTILEKSY